MTLKETLSTPEAKKMYHKLSMKHHPDKGGSTSTMKKVNAAASLKYGADRAIKRLYSELEKDDKPEPKKKAYDDTKSQEKKFDLYDVLAEIQDEINNNAKKLGVKDRIFLSVRKNKQSNTFNLVASFIDSMGNQGTFHMFNVGKYKTKKSLKNAIIEKFIEALSG